MNKTILFILLLMLSTLNSLAQEKKSSLFDKVVEKAINVSEKTIKTVANVGEEIITYSTDSIGRGIDPISDALSSRFLRRPDKIRMFESSMPLGQVIYNNNPKQLEKYLETHNIDINETYLSGSNRGSLGAEYKLTLLQYALMAYTPHSVKILLDRGADPNSKSYTAGFWEYPLQVALINNPSGRHKFNLVEDVLKAGGDPSLFPSVAHAVNVAKSKSKDLDLLLAYGAKIDVKDDEGKTGLFYAVEQQHWDAANFLVEKGANIRTANEKGEDLPSIIQEQLNQLPQKNKTPTIWDPPQVYIGQGLYYISTGQALFSALQTNGSKFYYTKNPRLNPRTVEYFDVSTKTGLHCFEVSKLITYDKAEELKQYLTTNELSINMSLGQDKEYVGSTLLDHAILANAKNVFTMLIDMGADLNKKSIYPHPTKEGHKIAKIALRTALGNPDLFYVEKLINSGVNFSAVQIIDLVKLGSEDSMKSLIELWLTKGADIDRKDPKTERTAIYYAIDRADVMYSTAVLLVRQGADLTVKDKNNETPVEYLQKKLNAINTPNNSMFIYQHSELSVLIKVIQDKGFNLYYSTEDEKPTQITT